MAIDYGAERYYTNPGDIYGVFRTLQADRSTINIQFGNRNTLYNSLVLDADLQRRIVQLDEITPAGGHDRAVAGEPFSLRASINGIRVYAPALTVFTPARDENGIYYQVRFPEKLLYLQRRDAFRVPVPIRMGMSVRCRLEERAELIKAGVENLSATGIGLQVPGETAPQLPGMARLEMDLELPAPENQSLRLEATVIPQHYDTGRKLTILGCRFENLKRSHHIALNRVVTQLQREALT